MRAVGSHLPDHVVLDDMCQLVRYELGALGGSDAGAVAKALSSKGSLSVWQYAVRKAANGDLEQAPRAKIGLIAHDSLRVEPLSSPLKVIPHE